MISFKEDLLQKGYELLDSCNELAKLKEDAQKILGWIKSDINILNYKAALQFDKEIRAKHKEIEPLNILANTIANIRATAQGSQNSTYNYIDKIYDTLKFDYNVILGKALLKTDKIMDLAEILVQ